MGISHIPAHACYHLCYWCASPGRVWLPLLCTLPLDSYNSGEVSLSPLLTKTEPAYLCLTFPHIPCTPISATTETLHLTHSFVSECLLCWEPKPGENTPGVASAVISVWKALFSLATLGVGTALLHGCTAISWPHYIPPGSQGLSCRAAPQPVLSPSLSYCRTLSILKAQLCIDLCATNPVRFPSANFSCLKNGFAFKCNTQFGVTCKHSKSSVQPIMEVVKEGIKLHQSHCQSLRCTIHNWPSIEPHSDTITLWTWQSRQPFSSISLSTNPAYISLVWLHRICGRSY